MSFSNVKYDKIAGSDIRPLETFRSRIPNNLFRKICKDVNKATAQYGRMASHDNEEARSRFIASICSSYCVSHAIAADRKMQLFSEIIVLFGNVSINKPEGLL